MKRNFLSVSVTLFLILMFSSLALAGPKVAIVKSDSEKLGKEDFFYEMVRIVPYDVTKPIDKILASVATWGPEREAAIEKMVREAIKLAGDWPVKTGNTVFIKPNLLLSAAFMRASNRIKPEFILVTVTDPRVVRAVALVALESGAKSVMFGDQPGTGDSYAVAKEWGYEKVAMELNKKYPGKVKCFDLKTSPHKFYKPPKTGGLALKEYAIPQILVKSDVVISVPVLKTHVMTGVTLALKNIGIGAPSPNVYGQFKYGLPHVKLAEVITDVCDIVGIDYAVIAGIWGGEGNGPSLCNPVPMNMIIAGKDPVAVDWVGTECMGIKGDLIGTTRMGQKYGLGTYKDIEVVGIPIQQAMQQFEPAPRDARVPGVYGHNVGWGPDAVATK